MYFIIIVLLVVFGFIEFFLIKRGMKSGKGISLPSRNGVVSSPLSSLTNKYIHPKERRQESFSKQQEVIESEDRGEDIVSFPEKSQKAADLSDIKREIRQKESSVRDQSMLDIVQEIRGESGHPGRDSYELSQEQFTIETEQDGIEDAGAASKKESITVENSEEDEEIFGVTNDSEEVIGGWTSSEEEVIEEVEVVSPEELLKLGLDLIRKGELDEGIEKIEELVEYVPEKADAHFNLGIAYTLKEDIPQAISAYQRAIEVDPKYGKAFFNLGTLYLKQGKIPEAITQLEQSVKFLPDSTKALWNLYEAYRSKGLFTKALSSLQRLIELEPEDASLYNHLGICYVKLGDYRKAIDSWKRSLSLGALSPLIHYNLGKTYELCGEFAAAKEHYNQFIAFASKSSDLKELITEVQDRLDNLLS